MASCVVLQYLMIAMRMEEGWIINTCSAKAIRQSQSRIRHKEQSSANYTHDTPSSRNRNT